MKVTLEDIAEKTNVSKMTVSRVINETGNVAEETRKKIEKAIEEMDYQPNQVARNLSVKKTYTIGVIIPKEEKIFLDNYIAQVLSGVNEVGKKNGYKILLLPIEEENFNYAKYIKNKTVDGLVLIKMEKGDKGLEKIANTPLPYVLVNFRDTNDRFNYVDTNNIEGAKKGVEYLYQKGHSKIGFIAGEMSETNSIDRLTGFKEAMQENDLELNDNWVLHGHFSQKSAYNAMGKILDGEERPTAIFCSDDYMAIGAIERIKDEGYSVPEDFAVMGFDNIELAEYVTPSLTTIAQPMHELGKEATQLVFDIINDKKNIITNKILPVELIERESA